MSLIDPKQIPTVSELCQQVLDQKHQTNRHAISNMERALSTYRTRNRVYGNNYKRFGAIMHALYPDGIQLDTPHQHNRFGIILQMISKLSRYVTDPLAGHIDSIHDMGVYCFMLEELDSEQAGMDVASPVKLVTTVKQVELQEALPNPCEHSWRNVTPEELAADATLDPDTLICRMCGDKNDDSVRHGSY